jgi:nitrite reductase/ring-hydroxylating ferredoxin subunit
VSIGRPQNAHPTARTTPPGISKDESANLLGAAGIAGGLAAFATGIADWSVTDGRDRRLALLHGLLNTAGLALQGAALTARLRGRRRRARNWSGVGLATTYASAYLGGHLVMGRGQMVNHARPASGPRKWIPVVRERDLEQGQTRTVQVEEREILLYRSDGVISAIEGTCSHAGAPLGRGKVENGVVTCPWHGSRFDLVDGRVLRGPAQHSQPLLETRYSEGWIEVRRR